MKGSLIKILAVVFFLSSLSGCTIIFQKGRRSDVEKIEQLTEKLDELQAAKNLLEERLANEIRDKQVKLQMMDRGLVITFLADILFDSGKAKLRPESYPILDKVARVLRENVPGLSVGVEGYTDNQPIKVSGWKSNWELSANRALSVVHYLSEEKGVSPERLSAIGYGEHRPIDTNDTLEGRQNNRRVEVVIMPKVTKVTEEPKGLKEPAENLK